MLLDRIRDLLTTQGERRGAGTARARLALGQQAVAADVAAGAADAHVDRVLGPGRGNERTVAGSGAEAAGRELFSLVAERDSIVPLWTK